MFEKLKGNILFKALLKRPDISKAYKMVDEKDSWFDTISTVHKSLAEIQKREHSIIEIKSHDDYKLISKKEEIICPDLSNKACIWLAVLPGASIVVLNTTLPLTTGTAPARYLLISCCFWAITPRGSNIMRRSANFFIVV